MDRHRLRLHALAAALAMVLPATSLAQSAASTTRDRARIAALEARLEAQDAQIQALWRRLEEPQHAGDAWAPAGSGTGVAADALDGLRARGGSAGRHAPVSAAVFPGAVPAQQASSPAQDGADAVVDTQVGQPPEESARPPEVAPIFDQPGVLTPRGALIIEPSLQSGYSSSDRVALVGYTVIPAILVGLIDVRRVKITTTTFALGARYGLGDRLEAEIRVPWIDINGDTISREIFTGAAQDSVFNADGRGLGDVEATVRYQLRNKGPDRPFYVLWLRYKARTGEDLFEVVTDCVTRCVANATGTGLPLELPTGSGFASIQPGVTWLFASDPVVFFGSFSYLHNFGRDDVSRTVLAGAPEGFPQTTTELIGDIQPGGIIGFNVGMGLALNEKAAISIGYDQSSVARIEQNGEDAPGAVRFMMGTLVLGASYRISERTSLNAALSVGVTRDTPDATFIVRVPMRF